MSDLKKKWESMHEAIGLLESRTHRFLRACGWEHTSNTTGSIWMWRKEMDGETYFVNQAHAIRIEEQLHAEEFYTED